MPCGKAEFLRVPELQVPLRPESDPWRRAIASMLMAAGLKALPQGDGLPGQSSGHTRWALSPKPAWQGAQDWAVVQQAHSTGWNTAAPPCPAWEQGQGQQNLCQNKVHFPVSTVVHSEEQLHHAAGWQNSVRLPVYISLGSPRPQPGPGSGAPLSQLLPMPWSKEGASELGEKKYRNRPKARKQHTGTSAAEKIDFCLLETVSRKCHSSFMLIHSGICLPPPANLASSPTECRWFPV